MSVSDHLEIITHYSSSEIVNEAYQNELIMGNIERIVDPSQLISAPLENAYIYYIKEYGSKQYSDYYRYNAQTYSTRDADHIYLKYPYEFLKTDPEFSYSYFTFDRNDLPLYIRYQENGCWYFFKSNTLTAEQVCYNYWMAQSVSSETIRNHKNETPSRFRYFKEHTLEIELLEKSDRSKLVIANTLTRALGPDVTKVIMAAQAGRPHVLEGNDRLTKKNFEYTLNYQILNIKSYFDIGSRVWHFKSINPVDDLKEFKSQIKNALLNIKACVISDVKNGGFIQVRFLFKYDGGIDINGNTESKFLHNGGTYPLISRCKQYDFMRSDDINIFEADTDEIVRYLYIRLSRKYSPDTLLYSDESPETLTEEIDFNEFKIEVITLNVFRAGGIKSIKPLNDNELMQELYSQRIKSSSKYIRVESLSHIGVVKNRFDKGGLNGCFIHALKEKLEQIKKSRNIDIYIDRDYRNFWRSVDQNVNIQSMSKDTFPFTDDYINAVSKFYNLCITIYDKDGNIIKRYQHENYIDYLDILTIDMGNNTNHFCYIEKLLIEPKVEINKEEVSLDVFFDFETINHKDGVYPYSCSYYIKDTIEPKHGSLEYQKMQRQIDEGTYQPNKIENILIKNDYDIESYFVIDELFTRIKEYIKEKECVSTNFSQHFIEFCKANNYDYSNDINYMVSLFLYEGRITFTKEQTTMSWNDKLNIVFKNPEFNVRYHKYLEENPLRKFKVRFIAYNGSKFDFNILYNACLKFNTDIVTLPHLTGRINVFSFLLTTPRSTEIEVHCWDLNSFISGSLIENYNALIVNDGDKAIKTNKIIDSNKHREIQRKWNELNSNLPDSVIIPGSEQITKEKFVDYLETIKDEIITYNNKDVEMLFYLYNHINDEIKRYMKLSPEYESYDKRIEFKDKNIANFPTISNFAYNMYLKSNTIYKTEKLPKINRRDPNKPTHRLKGQLKSNTPNKLDNEIENIAIRSSIIGGRVEGEVGIHHIDGVEIDVNGLYNHVMLFYKYPVGIRKTSNNPQEIYNSKFEGFFYCSYSNFLNESGLNFYLPYYKKEILEFIRQISESNNNKIKIKKEVKVNTKLSNNVFVDDEIRIYGYNEFMEIVDEYLDLSEYPDRQNFYKLLVRKSYLPKITVKDFVDHHNIEFLTDESVLYWDDNITVEELEKKSLHILGTTMKINDLSDYQKFLDKKVQKYKVKSHTNIIKEMLSHYHRPFESRIPFMYIVDEFLLDDIMYDVYVPYIDLIAYNQENYLRYTNFPINETELRKSPLNYCFCLPRTDETRCSDNQIQFLVPIASLIFNDSSNPGFSLYINKAKKGKMEATNPIIRSLFKSMQVSLTGKFQQAPYTEEFKILKTNSQHNDVNVNLIEHKIRLRAKYDFLVKSNVDKFDELYHEEEKTEKDILIMDLDSTAKFKRRTIHKINQLFKENKCKIEKDLSRDMILYIMNNLNNLSFSFKGSTLEARIGYQKILELEVEERKEGNILETRRNALKLINERLEEVKKMVQIDWNNLNALRYDQYSRYYSYIENHNTTQLIELYNNVPNNPNIQEYEKTIYLTVIHNRYNLLNAYEKNLNEYNSLMLEIQNKTQELQKLIEEENTYILQNHSNLTSKIIVYLNTYYLYDLYELTKKNSYVDLKTELEYILYTRYLDEFKLLNEKFQDVFDPVVKARLEKTSTGQSIAHIIYDNLEKTSTYPIQIGSYILACSRSYMWNTCLNKVRYYYTDTDSAFIPISELDKLKGLYSIKDEFLEQIISDEKDEIIEKIKKNSVEDDYGKFKVEHVFSTLICISKKFYCLLDKEGNIIKYRTKGITDDSLYIDSLDLLNDIFVELGPKIKVSEFYKDNAEYKQKYDMIFNIFKPLDPDVKYQMLNEVLEPFKEDVDRLTAAKISEYTQNLIDNNIRNLKKFSDNMKDVYMTLLKRPLYFTSQNYVSSRRNSTFKYKQSFVKISR